MTTAASKAAKAVDFEKATGEKDNLNSGAQKARNYGDGLTDYLYRSAFPELKGKELGSGNVTKTVMDTVFAEEVTDVTFGSLGISVSELFAIIGEGRKPIKELKKAEREADKSIKKVIKDIEAAKKKDEKKEKSNMYDNASKYCTAYQTVITNITKAQIAVIKFDIKQCRAVVAKLAAYTPKKENAIFEMSCWMEAAEEVEEELDSVDPADAEADDVKVEIDISSDEGVDVEVNED